MYALKFMIQSNLCHASRVPAVKNLGALAPPAQWSRRLYLLTYLVGARAKVHSFEQKTAVAVATIRQ